MARDQERRFAAILERDFGVTFSGPRPIGEWGNLDNVAELDDGRWLALEVEAQQKHPCTNVLKVWPYLDVNLDTRFLFVHGFFTESASVDSSRGRLSSWLGERLTQELEWQFQYVRVVCDSDDQLIEGADELRAALATQPQPGCLGSLFGRGSSA
jgi:hypothetical protein